MSARSLFFAAGMLVLVGSGTAQQPIAPPVETPALPKPSVVPPIARPPAPSPARPIDQMLDELERVQVQKAELEKKEQELKATIHKALEKQTERLNKLGAAPKAAKAAEPDRVGRITLSGFAEKDEKKVREILGLSPGQVLQYPRLEDARIKLQRAGFDGVSVEVFPNGPAESTFKDIRVTSRTEADR